MPGIFSGAPVDRLTKLFALIALIEDRTTAREVLESLLRYCVQDTRQVDEPIACVLLQQHSGGVLRKFPKQFRGQPDATMRDLAPFLLTPFLLGSHSFLTPFLIRQLSAVRAAPQGATLGSHVARRP